MPSGGGEVILFLQNRIIKFFEESRAYSCKTALSSNEIVYSKSPIFRFLLQPYLSIYNYQKAIKIWRELPRILCLIHLLSFKQISYSLDFKFIAVFLHLVSYKFSHIKQKFISTTLYFRTRYLFYFQTDLLQAIRGEIEKMS